ncbi:MAG: GGDEF domain-containing protein [Pseudomonadota bacterium]
MLEWDDDTKIAMKDREDPNESPRDRAYLIVLAGSNIGEMFKLSRNHMVIGRGPTDIQIPDEGISRRHAEIQEHDGEVVINDLGSRNGTFVNGDKIERQVLHDGDKIRVGSTTILKFTYHDRLDESFQRQMYEAALRDGLTKAFNRKYFLDRLESEFRFAKRHSVPLSLVFFDIDHFKEINETHGFIAGDFILSTLARRVQGSIRSEDVFARYGGEEFAIICRATDMHGAGVFAERLRATIESFEFRFGTTVIPVTVSMGVAGLPQLDAADPLGLVAATDEALASAKQMGRNRVQIASEEPAPTTE